VSLKNRGPIIILALATHQTSTSVDGVGLRALAVDSVNSSNDYFAYLCVPESEIYII
jgi:hypothetical protein